MLSSNLNSSQSELTIENILEKCSCTPSYYCSDENQYEPGHKCSNCIDKESLEMKEMFEMEPPSSSYKPVVIILGDNEIPDDDLPF
jgi:hypothetical protein